MTPNASVLVDSSIWVRSWRPGFADVRAGLHELIEKQRVAGHPFVFGELLVGDQGTRHDALALYPHVTTRLTQVPHQEVVVFVRQHRLSGRGLGWIDCHLLAAAAQHELWLWTADAALMRTARTFGLAFEER